MSAVKSNKTKDLQNATLVWMQPLQKSKFLLQLIVHAQHLQKECFQIPHFQLQLQDLTENYQLLQQNPLTKLQTHRLMQTKNIEDEQRFQQFKQLWLEQVCISKQSHQLLAPNQPYARFRNAEIERYQIYLLHLFFILLSINEDTLKPASYMQAFVQWMNGIQPAYTTSKVTLRIEPNVKSEILFELPKHAQVEVCEEHSPYWKKIRVAQDNQDLYGFVMSAYLKF